MLTLATLGERSFAVATRAGTVKTATLALALGASGFEATTHDGFLTVTSNDADLDLPRTILQIASGAEVSLFGERTNLVFEKFHHYLNRDMLKLDAFSSKLDLASLPDLCKRILQTSGA